MVTCLLEVREKQHSNQHMPIWALFSFYGLDPLNSTSGPLPLLSWGYIQMCKCLPSQKNTWLICVRERDDGILCGIPVSVCKSGY